VCYFENNFSFFEINDNDFKWKCESSYIITKKSLECMWYCAIYVCMIMKRKKIVLLAQKLRRKKLRIRKEFPIFVPDDPPDGLITKKSSISFLEEKNYTQRIWRQDGMIFGDDTEMFLFLFWYNNTVDICGHYIFFLFFIGKLNSSDKNYPCCSGTVPSGT